MAKMCNLIQDGQLFMDTQNLYFGLKFFFSISAWLFHDRKHWPCAASVSAFTTALSSHWRGQRLIYIRLFGTGIILAVNMLILSSFPYPVTDVGRCGLCLPGWRLIRYVYLIVKIEICILGVNFVQGTTTVDQNKRDRPAQETQLWPQYISPILQDYGNI